MSETTNLKLFKHDNPSTNENQFNVESALNENWNKIDEAYGKLNTNKADKTDVQEIEQDISNIKSNQTTQNDLLQRTQNALINITTPKSSNINVKDSSDLNAKVDVYGISEQDGEPSPSNIVEIENVTGDIDITVSNKNLFNKENYDALSDYTVQMEGTMSSYRGKALQLKPNTTYAVSRLINNFTASGSWVLRILDADKVTSLTILQESSYSSDIKTTITTGETGIIYIAELYATDERLQDFFSKCEIQIEENNSSTEYVAHEEQLITFPLKENQKLYDKDYLGSNGIHHVRKQIELDGTETVIDSGYNESTRHFTIRSTDKAFGQMEILSNMFVNSTVSTKVYSVVGNNSNTNITFKMPLEYTTVDSFKAFLSQQKENGTPVIVEYELETEEIEPYTPEQQEAYDQLQNVLSYYNVTNVFTDKALLVFKYIADTKTYVDNQYNALANQVLEIMGGN